MRRFLFLIVPLLALAPAVWAWAHNRVVVQKQEPASQDKDQSDKIRTPEEQLKAVLADYRKASLEAKQAYLAAKTPQEGQKIRKEFESTTGPKFAKRALAIGQDNLKDKAGLEALEMALMLGHNNADSAKALELIVDNHLDNPQVGQFCLQLASSQNAAVEKLSRAVIEKSKDQKMLGMANLALGVICKNKAEDVDLKADERQKASKEAEEQFEKVTAKFKEPPQLAATAKSELFALRHLSIGKEAFDVKGEDEDGKALKLSDYRGKIVVLDFWASWCGPCMAMVPHERTLVKRLEGKPFVMLGVSLDNTREDLKKCLKDNEMTWRTFFDGQGGPIGQQWQIQSIPMVYVIDPKGIIRFKNVRGADLDKAVDTLVAELEPKTK